MFKAKQYRAKAAESAESLKHTDVPSEIREFQRSKESFTALAQNEDWLANNFDKIIHSEDVPPQDDDAGTPGARATVAETEERILRCLGAAVIMQWNTIPTKLQRELFDTAGSMGDVLKSAALRAQIARFLHSHKDEESPAGFASKPTAAKGTPHAT
jgi:rubrerythrin